MKKTLKKSNKKLSQRGDSDSELKLEQIISALEWQKEELKRLQSIAQIEREKEEQLKSSINSSLIKVVLGPRRSGKSMMCIRVLSECKHVYINFDDDLLSDITDSNLLLKAIKKSYGDTKTILLDEVQNFSNWELFVSKLQRSGYNLIVTGSNAHLLSDELATALTGRHFPVELFPLSFKEVTCSSFKGKKTSEDDILSDYCLNGGFPEPLLNGIETINYLRTLFDSILYKDIVKRFKIRNPELISRLGVFLANNISSHISVERLGRSLEIGSNETTQRFLGYLQQTCLFFLLERFFYKVRKQLRSSRKCYIYPTQFILSQNELDWASKILAKPSFAAENNILSIRIT